MCIGDEAELPLLGEPRHVESIRVWRGGGGEVEAAVESPIDNSHAVSAAIIDEMPELLLGNPANLSQGAELVPLALLECSHELLLGRERITIAMSHGASSDWRMVGLFVQERHLRTPLLGGVHEDVEDGLPGASQRPES